MFNIPKNNLETIQRTPLMLSKLGWLITWFLDPKIDKQTQNGGYKKLTAQTLLIVGTYNFG